MRPTKKGEGARQRSCSGIVSRILTFPTAQERENLRVTYRPLPRRGKSPLPRPSAKRATPAAGPEPSGRRLDTAAWPHALSDVPQGSRARETPCIAGRWYPPRAPGENAGSAVSAAKPFRFRADAGDAACRDDYFRSLRANSCAAAYRSARGRTRGGELSRAFLPATSATPRAERRQTSRDSSVTRCAWRETPRSTLSELAMISSPSLPVRHADSRRAGEIAFPARAPAGQASASTIPGSPGRAVHRAPRVFGCDSVCCRERAPSERRARFRAVSRGLVARTEARGHASVVRSCSEFEQGTEHVASCCEQAAGGCDRTKADEGMEGRERAQELGLVIAILVAAGGGIDGNAGGFLASEAGLRALEARVRL